MYDYFYYKLKFTYIYNILLLMGGCIMDINKEEYCTGIEVKEREELINLIANIKDVTIIRRLKLVVLGVIKFTQ